MNKQYREDDKSLEDKLLKELIEEYKKMETEIIQHNRTPRYPMIPIGKEN